MILLYIALILYPIFHGWKEALCLSRDSRQLVKERGVIGWFEMFAVSLQYFLPPFFLYRILNIKDIVFVFICYLLAFHFFYDGVFTLVKKYKDGSYYGFTDEIKNTFTLLSYPYVFRLSLFLSSLLILFMYLVSNK